MNKILQMVLEIVIVSLLFTVMYHFMNNIDLILGFMTAIILSKNTKELEWNKIIVTFKSLK